MAGRNSFDRLRSGLRSEDRAKAAALTGAMAHDLSLAEWRAPSGRVRWAALDRGPYSRAHQSVRSRMRSFFIMRGMCQLWHAYTTAQCRSTTAAVAAMTK